jgi:hypothetical protein
MLYPRIAMCGISSFPLFRHFSPVYNDQRAGFGFAGLRIIFLG